MTRLIYGIPKSNFISIKQCNRKPVLLRLKNLEIVEIKSEYIEVSCEESIVSLLDELDNYLINSIKKNKALWTTSNQVCYSSIIKNPHNLEIPLDGARIYDNNRRVVDSDIFEVEDKIDALIEISGLICDNGKFSIKLETHQLLVASMDIL